MAKYSVLYLQAAENDLTNIFEYVVIDNKLAANNLLDAIEKSIQNLELFPELGIVPKNRRLANKGYRILIISDYLAFYRVRGSVIRVMRILYGKRNYANIL
ncbi:MAG: type II toxin-antitoxin system RelE/ParE family toxin [Bacillota bacterium]